MHTHWRHDVLAEDPCRLVAGVALGVFPGELVVPLAVLADGFVKLLQMTVLSYVVISILTGLGSLDDALAGTQGG
jgi:Na+/H+-dicarboxylate symporter